MSPRERVPLPFGAGLDRETGQAAVQPGSMGDLRNVHTRLGKYVVRRGVESVMTFLDANGDQHTHVLAGHMLLGERAGVVVAYQGGVGAVQEGDVDIYLIDNEAESQRRLGNWFNVVDLELELDPPPIVHIATSYGRAFFAHDEYRVKNRAPTFVYDPFEGAELTAMQADFDGNGDEDVQFRGVMEYLEYLVGWGFGSATEDRAELVRFSKPGEPRDFDPDHYMSVGSRRDPTIVCRPAGSDPSLVLMVFKETKTYRVDGDSKIDFRERLADQHFGCVGGRLAVTVGDRCYFWSATGPRVTNGRASEDIAIPLELAGSEPDDLPDRGELEQGWAGYIPEVDEVVFAFNRRLYVLDVRLEPPRWKYWDLGFDQFAGFHLYSTGVGAPAVSAPVGYPDFLHESNARLVEADDDYPGLTDRMTPSWNNIDEDGDEMVEVHLREAIQRNTSWRMNEEGDVAGEAKGWVSESDANITDAYSIEDHAQKIEVTASTGPGVVSVLRTVQGLSAGDVVDISFACGFENLVAGCVGEIAVRWYDAADAFISEDTLPDLTHPWDSGTPDSQGERRYLTATAPAGADYLQVHARMRTAAAGDTGVGYFRTNLVAVQSEYGEWERYVSVPVDLSDPQEAILGQISDALPSGTFYEIALRYRRGTFYTAGYEDSEDPTTWPDVSRGCGVVGQTQLSLDGDWREVEQSATLDSPTVLRIDIVQEVWDRIIEAANEEGKDAGIRLYRRSPSALYGDPFDTLVPLGDLLFEETVQAGAVPPAVGVDPEGVHTVIYLDSHPTSNPDNQEFFFYQVTWFVESEESEPSNEIKLWTGPFPPPNSLGTILHGDGTLSVFWVNAQWFKDLSLAIHNGNGDNLGPPFNFENYFDPAPYFGWYGYWDGLLRLNTEIQIRANGGAWDSYLVVRDLDANPQPWPEGQPIKLISAYSVGDDLEIKVRHQTDFAEGNPISHTPFTDIVEATVT